MRIISNLYGLNQPHPMKPVEMVKSTLQYIVGILLLFLSLGLLIERNFLFFIFILIVGLICLPPSRKWIEGQLGLRLPTALRYMLVLGAIISFVIFVKPPPDAAPDAVQGLYQSRPEDASASKDKVAAPVKTTTTVTTTTTTVEPVAAPVQGAQTAYAKTEDADVNSGVQTEADEADDEPETVVEQPAPVKHKYSRRRASREYIRGPRGGCYYINGNGNKTYVDRSMCD